MQQSRIEEKINGISEYLGVKGYGDREQELSFMAEFFSAIFEKYPQLTEFEWSQYQDWSDQGLYFDLVSYRVNRDYKLEHTDPFERAPMYMKYNPTLKLDYIFLSIQYEREALDFDYETEEEFTTYYEKYNEHYANLQIELEPLRKPVNCILTFLKAIYEHHRPYYFIYVFGRRAKVTISAEGMLIDNNELIYRMGNVYDQRYNP